MLGYRHDTWVDVGRRLTMRRALLVVLPLLLSAHPGAEKIIGPVVLAELSPDRAVWYRVTLDSAGAESEGCTLFDCEHGRADVMPNVLLPRTGGGEQSGDVLSVRGRRGSKGQ